jgi:hypothetical protein
MIFMLIGVCVLLVGLMFVGWQVNKHRIDPASGGAWLVRFAALLIVLGLLTSHTDALVRQLGRLLGAMLVGVSVIMVNHEWVQAGTTALAEYHFKPTADMLILFFAALLAPVVVLIGAAAGATWVNFGAVALLIVLIGFWARLIVSAERRRAHFAIGRSLTLQVFACGAIVLLLALG